MLIFETSTSEWDILLGFLLLFSTPGLNIFGMKHMNGVQLESGGSRLRVLFHDKPTASRNRGFSSAAVFGGIFLGFRVGFSL